MKYRADGMVRRRPWLRRIVFTIGVVVVLIGAATVVVWHYYNQNIRPVSAHGVTQEITIESGSPPTSIANLLHGKHLIRSAWTFERYVQSKGVSSDLQAGTYT